MSLGTSAFLSQSLRVWPNEYIVVVAATAPVGVAVVVVIVIVVLVAAEYRHMNEAHY